LFGLWSAVCGLWSLPALLAFYSAAGVLHGGFDVLVSECLLQFADGFAVFEAVDGVGVPEGHGGDGFEDAGGVAGTADGEFDHAGAEGCHAEATLEDVVGG